MERVGDLEVFGLVEHVQQLKDEPLRGMQPAFFLHQMERQRQ